MFLGIQKRLIVTYIFFYFFWTTSVVVFLIETLFISMQETDLCHLFFTNETMLVDFRTSNVILKLRYLVKDAILVAYV